MRILFLGDVVGRSGRDAVLQNLSKWRQEYRLDFIMVNAENASHGFGLGPMIAKEFFDAGVDSITLGNHAFDRKEIIPVIHEFPYLVRPLNYPKSTPGNGFCIKPLPNGKKVLVINVAGRIFMNPIADDPFAALENLLSRFPLGRAVQAIILDVHGEATSEKLSIGNAFDGQVSLVVGTHTHIPTADTRILPRGTAYQTDAGMCGDYESVIGMQKEGAVLRTRHPFAGGKLAPASGEACVCGVMIETDDKTGLALSVKPFRQGVHLMQAEGLGKD
ncbi:TIGR00282 family metallophosphoesterase [Acetobacteraceae bacterium]|nr:TIGR00282 family metallophosphoesterase [Acetobacteraceae bacterium]